MKYIVENNKLIINVQEKFLNKTLREFLLFFKQSKKNMYLLFLNKKIFVNDNFVKSDYIIKKYDVISIIIDEENIDYTPEQINVDVVYEDDIFLIINKPNNLIVHDVKNSLANRVAYYYLKNDYRLKVRHLHRLDKETQGLIMYCKISFLQPYLDFMLSNKDIKRFYKAIVFGKFTNKKVIDFNISKDRHVNNKYRVSKNGLSAKTIVTPVKIKNNYSLVECELKTGRTHQIRVHLSSIGFCIVNDLIYGRKTRDFDCMGLFAYCLKFKDPISEKENIVKLNDNINLNYFEKL